MFRRRLLVWRVDGTRNAAEVPSSGYGGAVTTLHPLGVGPVCRRISSTSGNRQTVGGAPWNVGLEKLRCTTSIRWFALAESDETAEPSL